MGVEAKGAGSSYWGSAIMKFFVVWIIKETSHPWRCSGSLPEVMLCWIAVIILAGNFAGPEVDIWKYGERIVGISTGTVSLNGAVQ